MYEYAHEQGQDLDSLFVTYLVAIMDILLKLLRALPALRWARLYASHLTYTDSESHKVRNMNMGGKVNCLAGEREDGDRVSECYLHLPGQIHKMKDLQ